MNSTLEILRKADRPFYRSDRIYISVRPVRFEDFNSAYDVGWELCIVDEDDGHVFSRGASVYNTREEAIAELKRTARRNHWRKIR